MLGTDDGLERNRCADDGGVAGSAGTSIGLVVMIAVAIVSHSLRELDSKILLDMIAARKAC